MVARVARRRRVSPFHLTSVSQSKTTLTDRTDPNMPKRGLSAYMFFANENRDKVREDNPGIKFGEVGKLLGEKWKSLTDKDKTPYEAKAAKDKKRYEEEKAAYTAVSDVSDF
ncbi:hypothetical protein K431DRAFT_217648 [Polychaeton citri CBS 116435]|uniref:Non-histone chromosomal protein 6 n=1 Tax=Polychaeton citri CBS 116435 TaxID=1314669 RepID=A0A9P4QEV1_9PEZI|nr:hypothetical protein K431DRAFT_217648 [Polychaeton citri CBS 116435]